MRQGVQLLIKDKKLKTHIEKILLKFCDCGIDKDSRLVIASLFDIEYNAIITNLPDIYTIQKKIEIGNHIIFIVDDLTHIPLVYEPEKIKSSYINKLLGIPEFNSKEKAILYAELKYDLEKKKFFNVINISDYNFTENLRNLIINFYKEVYPFNDEYNMWKDKYYCTFIEYYERLGFGADTKKNKIVESILQDANDRYNNANGLSYNLKNTHTIPLELFSAPLPFLYCELINSRSEIEGVLKNKKIKLLLIDNKADKIINEDLKQGPLCELLSSSDLDLFELYTVGNSVFKKHNNKWGFFDNDNHVEIDATIKDSNVFDFKRFKNVEQPSESADIRCKKSEIPYFDFIYKKIKEADFILLDFFLNNENTYLAYNFIEDISKHKLEKGDYAPVWYFITTAAYDSVINYSQSGLLAEHYDFAVVNSGDNPVNGTRQVIFLYKLLTFINARIKKYKKYQSDILDKILTNPLCNNKHSNYIDSCKKNECLEKLLTYIRQCLLDLDFFLSTMFDTNEQKVYAEVIELLADTINKFLLLPEADWLVIQQQIEFINVRLRSVDDDRSFSCNHITEVLKRRSEIY